MEMRITQSMCMYMYFSNLLVSMHSCIYNKRVFSALFVCNIYLHRLTVLLGLKTSVKTSPLTWNWRMQKDSVFSSKSLTKVSVTSLRLLSPHCPDHCSQFTNVANCTIKANYNDIATITNTTTQSTTTSTTNNTFTSTTTTNTPTNTTIYTNIFTNSTILSTTTILSSPLFHLHVVCVQCVCYLTFHRMDLKLVVR